MLQSVMEGEGDASSTTDGAPVGARAWREGTCDHKFWSCPGAAGFRVRGPKYTVDKKKVEAGPPVFALMATELIRTQRKSFNVAEMLPSVKCGQVLFFRFVYHVSVCQFWIQIFC